MNATATIATPKQAAFLARLASERSVPTWVADAATAASAGLLTAKDASSAIETALASPWKASQSADQQADLGWLALSTETQTLKVRAMVAELGEYMEAISTGERFEAALAELRAAANQPIPAEPKVVIESLGSRYNLRASEQDSALLALAESRDYTRWGLANAITWIANDASSYDRGVELEAVGGSIMSLGRREYAALAHVEKNAEAEANV